LNKETDRTLLHSALNSYQ